MTGMDGFFELGAPMPQQQMPLPPEQQQQQQQGTPQQIPPAPGQQQVPDPNMDDLNPWKEVDDTGGQQQQQQQQAAGTPGQQQTAPQPNQTMEQAIQSLNLDADFDAASIAEELGIAPENLGKLQGAMRAGLNRVYMQSAILMKKAMDAMEKSVEQRLSQSVHSDIRADTALTMLEHQVPMLKDPAWAPMAKATLGGFMRQSNSIETAVNKTVKYFQKMHNDMGKTFQQQQQQTNPRPGGMPGGFPGPQFQQSQAPSGGPLSGDDVDWHALFGEGV